ncbi:hypothetical protein [Actinomadura sp. KC216]|nr:hypothetical protein [Actinomadura sp. KC216]
MVGDIGGFPSKVVTVCMDVVIASSQAGSSAAAMMRSPSRRTLFS